MFLFWGHSAWKIDFGAITILQCLMVCNAMIRCMIVTLQIDRNLCKSKQRKRLHACVWDKERPSEKQGHHCALQYLINTQRSLYNFFSINNFLLLPTSLEPDCYFWSSLSCTPIPSHNYLIYSANRDNDKKTDSAAKSSKNRLQKTQHERFNRKLATAFLCK